MQMANNCRVTFLFVNLPTFDPNWRAIMEPEGTESRADLKVETRVSSLFHSIHGTGIFAYIYHKNQMNVGKYTIHGWYGLQST